MLFVSKETEALGNAIIETYKDWKQFEYTFKNMETGDSIWTASGYPFYKMVGHDAWGIFEQIFINRCIQKAKTRIILSKN